MKPLSEEQAGRQVENIRANGYSIMEGAIEPELIEEIRAELDRLAVRHYGRQDSNDDYLQRRNELHAERMTASLANRPTSS